MMKLVIFLFMLIFYNYVMINKFKGIYLSNMIFMVIFFFFFFNFNNYWMVIYSNLGFDKISFMLILLTLWIFALIFLIKNSKFEN